MPKFYKVLWTKVAQGDLEEIVLHIAKERLQTALKIFKNFRNRASYLKRSPKRGRKVPELAHIKGLDIRELIIGPWRLFYTIEKRLVYIHALFDSRRDLEEILFERLTRMY